MMVNYNAICKRKNHSIFLFLCLLMKLIRFIYNFKQFLDLFEFIEYYEKTYLKIKYKRFLYINYQL
jgi:hypothetical protein